MLLSPDRHRRRAPRALVAVVVTLCFALAPVAGFADEAEAPYDFLEEDDDFLGDPEPRTRDAAADDFLDEDYEEEKEEERGFAYWAVNVPIDVLLSRPIALTDTLVGGLFFTVATPFIGLATGSKAVWEYVKGEGWYYDGGGIQAARQICIDDPWDYAWNRPLGQLSSEF